MTSHRCLSCTPGPDRIVDHDRTIVNAPRVFRGPATSLHGGAAAGLVACLADAHLNGPAVRFNVRLHSPPPLLTDLAYRVELDEVGGVMRFEIGPVGSAVLSGWAATEAAEPVVPADIVAELAGHATLSAAEQTRFDAYERPPTEEFSQCFGCGSSNEDGLHLRTRAIDDHRAWIRWCPSERWRDGNDLSMLAAIAALDCTSAFPLQELGVTVEGETCLLGTYDGQIHQRPPVAMKGDFRIVTAPRFRQGRKIYADIGLFNPEGEVFITGCATWIVLAAA